jgi:hypothetical protein
MPLSGRTPDHAAIGAPMPISARRVPEAAGTVSRTSLRR